LLDGLLVCLVDWFQFLIDLLAGLFVGWLFDWPVRRESAWWKSEITGPGLQTTTLAMPSRERRRRLLDWCQGRRLTDW
jgi:hypothetical protein